MATLTKAPAYDSAGRADTTEAEGGRFHRAWGASVLVHGVVIGLLAGLTLTVTKRVEDTEPFVVVPDAGLAEASGGDRASGGVEAVRAAALFTAPPSVPTWVPPRPASRAAEVEVRDMIPMPRAKAESRVAGIPATKRPEEGTNGPRTTYRDFQSANRPAARIGPAGPSGGGRDRATYRARGRASRLLRSVRTEEGPGRYPPRRRAAGWRLISPG